MMKISNMRLARVKAGKTQIEVELETGIPQGHISQFERGYRTPKAEQLAALAEVYGVSLEDLEPEGRQVRP